MGWLTGWHWWTLPAGVAAGLLVNYVIWYVIPPRYPSPLSRWRGRHAWHRARRKK